MTQHKHTSSIPWWPATLISLALLVTSTQGACVSLAKSKACPSYSKFYVDTGIPPAMTQFGISMTAFTTVEDFDKAVFNATGFLTSSDCTGYNKTVRIPYQDTLLCTIAVQEDSTFKNCGDKQPDNLKSNMCVNSCKLYQDGLTAMIQKYCPKASDALQNLANLTKICSRKEPNNWMGLHDTSASCINSLQNEIGTCGQGSVEEKCSFCKTPPPTNGTVAECCKDAAVTCKYPTTTTTTPAGATITGTNTIISIAPSPTSDEAPDSSSKTTLSSGTIGGIVGGALAGVILIAFLLFMCMRRSTKDRQDQGLDRQNSNSSARYNISAPKIREEGYMSSTAPIPMTTLPPMEEPSSLGLGSVFASSSTAAGAGTGVGGAGVRGGVGFAAGVGAAAAGVAGLAGQDVSGKQSYCQALYPYHASMADELDLTQGDIINVLRVYDDGWAAGVNLNTSKDGVFPVVCVMFVDESALDDDFDEVNMHSMTPMTLREEDQEGRRSPSGRNSPRSSLPSRSSSPVNLPRRNSSILRENMLASGSSPLASSPLASSSLEPPLDTSSVHRWWEGGEK